MKNSGKFIRKAIFIPPQYISEDAVLDRCLIGDGTEMYGEVHNSIIGCGVVIEKGAIVRDSIIMQKYGDQSRSRDR